MIRKLEDTGKAVQENAIPVGPSTPLGAHAGMTVGNKHELIDPEKILVDLKAREALLAKLINEGKALEDVSRLKESLSAAIAELEEIIGDPETEALSEEIL